MTSSLLTLLAGVVFGFALAAPPGPMNAIIAEESVVRGWSAGFWAGVGAMVADVLFLFLTLAGVVAVIDQYPAIRPVLYLAGGLLMCYFAIGAIREVRSAAFTDPDHTAASGFRKTFVLSLSNPYQIGFWLTVGVSLLQPGSIDVFSHVPGAHALLGGSLVVQTGSPALLIGLFGGIAIWIIVYPATLVAAGRRIDAVAPIVAGLSGLVLAGFGLGFLAIGSAGLL